MKEEKLPEGWATTEIRELCSLINGRAFKPSDWRETGLPIVRIQNLNNPKKPFNYHDKEVAEKFYIENQDLLFAWSGTPGTSFGAHIWRGGRAILNQHIFRVLIPEQLIDKLFFRLALNEKLNSFISEAHGGVGLRHITKGKFEKTRVFLPPLNEQKRIVAKIEALQAHSRRAREALKKAEGLLQKFRQSVLAAAFRGDLTKEWRKQNPNVEPAETLLTRIREERRTRWIAAEAEKGRARAEARATKASKPWTTADNEKALVKERDKAEKKYVQPEPPDVKGLPELPEGWCWATLDELLYNIYGGKSFKAEGRPAKKDEFGVLKISSVSWGKFQPNENKAVILGTKIDGIPKVKKGNLLISRANTVELVGAVVLVDKDYPHLILPDKILCLEPITSGILKNYLLFTLRSQQVRTVFESLATGTSDSMRNLSHKKIRSAPIPLPPFEEQIIISGKIVSYNSTASDISDCSFKLAKQLKKLDQSILAKAFRGELVPQDPDDEPASVLLERIKAEREAAAPKKKKKTTRRKAAKKPKKEEK